MTTENKNLVKIIKNLAHVLGFSFCEINNRFGDGGLLFIKTDKGDFKVISNFDGFDEALQIAKLLDIDVKVINDPKEVSISANNPIYEPDNEEEIPTRTELSDEEIEARRKGVVIVGVEKNECLMPVKIRGRFTWV